MFHPRVLVLVAPHGYATALATTLRAGDRYEVVVPNVMAGEEADAEDGAFDVVVTTLPVPRDLGRVIVSLPDTTAESVTVTVGDLEVPLPVTLTGPSFVDDIVAMVERYGWDADRAVHRSARRDEG